MTRSSPHILMMSSQHNPYDGRIFHLEAKTLLANGYRVSILAPGKENSHTSKDGIDIHTFKKKPSGIQRKLSTVEALFSQSRKIKPDIYHLHEVDAPMMVASCLKTMDIGKSRNPKIIFDSHEVWPFFYARYARSRFSRAAVRNLVSSWESFMINRFVDGVIAAHELEENYYRWLNPWIPLRKVMGAPPISEWPEPEFKSGKINVIGHDGYFTLQRGMKIILHGFEMLAREYSDVNLLIAGAFQYPEDEEFFTTWIKRTRLHSRVEATGWIDRESILGYLDRMDAGVIANKLDIHSIRCFPANKFMYYLARAIPVISTPSPLYREYMRKNSVGSVMTKMSATDFFKSARYLMDNPQMVREMSKTGYTLARKEFNWETSSKELLNLYEEVLAK